MKTGKDLNEESVPEFISLLSDPQFTEDELAAITIDWKNKGETPNELALIAKYILNKIDTLQVGFDVVDCCGTGGDNSGTYNISTTCAFLAAACGLRVAKHGGRKTTSSSGSIDFLEILEVKTFSQAKDIKQELENKGLVFIASPATQNILGRWKGVCKKLKFFGQTGLIGTLTNPVNLSHQVLGVPKPEWGPLMLEALKILGRKRALVVHGHPTMDEASLCGKTQIWQLEEERTKYFELEPKELGFNIQNNYSLEELKGGNPEQNAKIFHQIINGQASKAILDTVLLNTALVLWLCGTVSSLDNGIQETNRIIGSGEVRRFLESFMT